MPSMQHDIAETTDLENISRDVANRKTGKTFFLKTCIWLSSTSVMPYFVKKINKKKSFRSFSKL